MYKLSGVTKNYRQGRDTVAALRGVDLCRMAGSLALIREDSPADSLSYPD